MYCIKFISNKTSKIMSQAKRLCHIMSDILSKIINKNATVFVSEYDVSLSSNRTTWPRMKIKGDMTSMQRRKYEDHRNYL